MSITIIGKGKTDATESLSSTENLVPKLLLADYEFSIGTLQINVNDIPQSHDDLLIELSNVYAQSLSGSAHAIINGKNSIGDYGWTIYGLDSSPSFDDAQGSEAETVTFGRNNSGALSILNTFSEASGGINRKASLYLKITDYSKTSVPKDISGFSYSGDFVLKFIDGYFTGKEPVTSFSLVFSSPIAPGVALKNSRIKLYGIKNAD